MTLVGAMSREYTLRHSIQSIKDQYDYILIDIQPSLGMLPINALACADKVIIPVQPRYLAAKGMTQLLSTIIKIRQQINPNLKIDGNSSQVETKLRTDAKVGEDHGDSRNQVQRYIRLTNLIPDLLDKVDTKEIAFNPGIFLEALNTNNAFDINGNLQYAGVTKAVPNFKYGGNVNLRGKSRTEKLALITQYYNQGYYLTIEVKGATPGNQHWVAITGVNGNNVNIVDPGSNGTDLWSSYEWSKSSQFNYFMVN